MSPTEKAQLNDRLGDYIHQLEQAQAFLQEGDCQDAAAFVANVAKGLPSLKIKLQLQPQEANQM